MSKASNLIANLRGFLAAADPAGRVHPQVNTLRAKTARMSITNPALQTLKKHDPRLRRCFTADPGPRAHLVRLLPGGNPGGRRAGR